MVNEKDLLSISESSAFSFPLVSVIIPTYNREKYLEQAVQSVLEQAFTNLECLIVDDGSTDNTREISQYLMSKDQRVRYLYQENRGVSSARNFGIENAKGEWIQFLDSDDWLWKDKINFQLEYAKNYDTNNSVFYCDMEIVFEKENKSILLREYPFIKEKMIDSLLRYFCLHCNGFLLKKSLAKKVIFDSRLTFLEDCKFQLDLLMQGVTFIHTPIVGHFYRIHESNTCVYTDFQDFHAADVGQWKPSSKDSYIKYYQIIQEQYKDFKETCQQRLIDFLKRTIEQKDTQRLDTIMSILDTPINLYGIKFTEKSQLKLLQKISLYIPIQGIYDLGRLLKKVLIK